MKTATPPSTTSGFRAAIGRSLEPLGAVTAGFLIAVAVLVLVGVVLVLIGVWVSRSWINTAIDGPHPPPAMSGEDATAASVTVV